MNPVQKTGTDESRCSNPQPGRDGPRRGRRRSRRPSAGAPSRTGRGTEPVAFDSDAGTDSRPGPARLFPGLTLAGGAVAASIGQAALIPTINPLLLAIVLGVLARNLVSLPESLESGLAFAAKRLLRLGIVVLGLQLALGDILALGPGMILVVVAVVTTGILATVALGRAMGISRGQSLLIACGFSICGAAAVAAAEGVIEAEDEEVVTAVALVVLFGTPMIPLLPFVAALLGLVPMTTGLWAGASIHEVAQVVAVGGALGASALGAAVVVKLARVLLLAPVMVVLGLQRRRRAEAGADGQGAKLPPVMPLFVAGFIAMVAVRSFDVVPAAVLGVAKPVQTALLAAAMFALGTGVRFSMFRRVGAKPFALAGLATLVVAAVGLTGVLTLGG